MVLSQCSLLDLLLVKEVAWVSFAEGLATGLLMV
jgi:hypothetical protein